MKKILPAYLWGIETQQIFISIVVILKLPAYLWGIETFYKLRHLPDKRNIASLPMRNWNLSAVIAGIVGALIASLPMRNWNLNLLPRSKRGPEIASLPMRNWNKIEDNPKSRLIYSDCQPTYEELKHFIGTAILISFPYCQPTYEELKLYGPLRAGKRAF